MADLDRGDLYWKDGEGAWRNDASYELINDLMDAQEANPSEDRCVWEEMWDLCNSALAGENFPPERRIRVLGVRGYAETRLGRNKEAIVTMRAVIDANPEDIWAYETLRLLQFRASDWIGSMRTTKALNAIPSYEFSIDILDIECKRRLTAYALLAVGGVLLVRYLWRRR